MRSAAKPIQAMNELFPVPWMPSVTEKQLALMCASHYGGRCTEENLFHAGEDGLTEKDLQCGVDYSINRL